MTRRGWGTAPSSGFETTAIIAGTSNRAFFHAAAAGLVGRIASGKQFPCTLRYESCFSALIYGDWPVSGHGHEKTENDLHGPSSFSPIPQRQSCIKTSAEILVVQQYTQPRDNLIQVFAEI